MVEIMRAALLLLLCLPSLGRAASEDLWRRVAVFSGDGSTVTPEFKVSREWRIRWQTAPQVADLTPFFVVEGNHADGEAGQLFTSAQSTGRDEAQGQQPGVFFLDVMAVNCDWKILVEERPPLDGTMVEGIDYLPPGVDPFAHLRTWTRGDGATVDAYFVSATETHVRMYRPSDGRYFDYPLWQLSQADRDFVKQHRTTTRPE